MADELRIGLQELLRKARMGHDADFLKEGVRVLSQALMEMEVEEHVGAARHERSAERVGQRNGYRERSWDTRVGTVELKVPRVRDGGYFPSLLEPRRRAERALAAVVQEAYVHGVSTRKVDELVKALGMTGISKSRVSELCEELDEEVERFRGRPLEGFYPYVWVDATYVKARQDGRVVSTAVVIAVGVKAQTGEREVLGLDVGPSEDGAFWASFLRSLVARGLSGRESTIALAGRKAWASSAGSGDLGRAPPDGRCPCRSCGISWSAYCLRRSGAPPHGDGLRARRYGGRSRGLVGSGS